MSNKDEIKKLFDKFLERYADDIDELYSSRAPQWGDMRNDKTGTIYHRWYPYTTCRTNYDCDKVSIYCFGKWRELNDEGKFELKYTDILDYGEPLKKSIINE